MADVSRRAFNTAAVLIGVALLAGSLVHAFLEGRWPASVPPEGPEYQLTQLIQALTAVDSRGMVDLKKLEAQREPLQRFMQSMARHAPASEPERFATADERLAFALNAFHAMTLMQLLENPQAPRGFQSWPIGGQRLNRNALRARFIDAVEDPRTALALFDGTLGSGVLDENVFAAEFIERQLTDATQRFIRRPANVRLEGKVVHLSKVLTDQRQAFLERVPPDRRNLLQVVWAFLPTDCEGLAPGCLTRNDLDRACGQRFDQCSVVSETPSGDAAVSQP